MSEFVTVLVIGHPKGISYEGAIDQRKRADEALRFLDLEVFGATTGRGDPAGEATGIILRAWEVPGA